MATKRTTLMLDRSRLMKLKRLAAQRGETLSSVVDDVLRLGLRYVIRTVGKRSRKRNPLPTFNMGLPYVDLNDRGQLFDLPARPT